MSDKDELDRSATSILLPGRTNGQEPTDVDTGLAHLRALLERQVISPRTPAHG